MSIDQSPGQGEPPRRGEPPERLAPPVADFPPGVREAAHVFGPYLYRENELLLVAPSPDEVASEVERLARLLADPALQRRLLWDVLLFRLFGEFPPEEHDHREEDHDHGEDEEHEHDDEEQEEGAERGSLGDRSRALVTPPLEVLRLLFRAFRGGLRVPLQLEDERRQRGSLVLLRLRPVPEVPDLVPALVHRLLRFSKEQPPRVARFTGGARDPGVSTEAASSRQDQPPPVVAPNHVFWTAPHPIGFSAAPPRATRAPGPDLPPFDADAPNPVVVAVVDNGIEGTRWFGDPAAVLYLDPIRDAADPPPAAGTVLEAFAGHGTFVAGVALAEAYRVADRAEDRRPLAVLSVRVSDGAGYIADETAAEGLHRLRDAVAAGAVPRPDVVVMAFGGFAHDGLGEPVPAVQDAVRTLVADPVMAGTVFVASAGNEGDKREVYPAALGDPRVVAIGATETTEQGLQRADFSNFGGWVTACASGTNILGPFTDADGVYVPEVYGGPTFGPVTLGPTAVWSGTSMSAGIAAGRLAGEVASGTAGDGVTAWTALSTSGLLPTVQGVGYSLAEVPETESEELHTH